MHGDVIPLHKAGSPYDQNDERARELSARFADADTPAILAAVLTRGVAGEIALVSSFGAESAVLLHLAAQIEPGVPVVFLNTEKHFAQTLSYRRKLAATLGLTNLIEAKPSGEELRSEDPGGELWRSDTDACCNLRKVRPLAGALANFDSWITGRKQFHGGARLRMPYFEATESHLKVNPLARWSATDITAYFDRHDLPQHPLVDQGFPSIGCWPCTHPVAQGGDVRAGRWRGKAKTECGIHV